MSSYLDRGERVVSGEKGRRKDAQRSGVSEQLENMCKCFHLKFCSLPLSQRFVSMLPSDDWPIKSTRGRACRL